jgi:hypothetical protein
MLKLMLKFRPNRYFSPSFLGWFWALPLTLIGLPLVVLAKVQHRWQARMLRSSHGYVFTAHSRLIASLLRLHPMGSMDAVAIGCCVLARDAQSLVKHLSHELIHVQQAQHWGVLFPIAYLASSVWQLLHGRCAYADNYFECQANAVQV